MKTEIGSFVILYDFYNKENEIADNKIKIQIAKSLSLGITSGHFHKTFNGITDELGWWQIDFKRTIENEKGRVRSSKKERKISLTNKAKNGRKCVVCEKELTGWARLYCSSFCSSQMFLLKDTKHNKKKKK